MTRRRALSLGAAAGLSAVLARPAAALARGASAPRGFGLRVTPADFPGGGRTSRVLRPSRRFDLVGLRGPRGDVEVRARRRDGRWSPWVPLAVHGDHAPDPAPTRPSGRRASDPVWTGSCEELQLRARGPVRSALRVHLVSVGPGARRRLASRRAGHASARVAQATGPATPPPYVPRATWAGTKVPPRALPTYGDVQVAFVHHTVTANGYGPAESAAIVLGIAKYHRDTNGWNDIGYNFLVDRYGQVFEGRAGGVDQAVVGAQAQGYNSHSTGVAVLGTYSSTGIPEAALEAVAHVVGWKLSLHAAPIEGQVVLVSGGGDLNRYRAGARVTLERICGHRDGDATSCPGNGLYAQLPEIRTRARRYAFTPDPATQAIQLTLAVARAKVAYDSQAAFSGTVVRTDGQPTAGLPVQVQRRGRTGFATIARTTTDGDGAWAVSVPWHVTGDVRVAVLGAVSPVVPVVCLPAVSSRRSVRRVGAGGVVHVRGGVRPAVAVTVLVERKGPDGRWRRSRAVRAKVRGRRYSAAVLLPAPGLYRLTAKAGTPAAHRAATPQYVRALRRH